MYRKTFGKAHMAHEWQSSAHLAKLRSLSKSIGLQSLPLLEYRGKSNQIHSLFYTGLPGFQVAWGEGQSLGVTKAGLPVLEILLR